MGWGGVGNGLIRTAKLREGDRRREKGRERMEYSLEE